MDITWDGTPYYAALVLSDDTDDGAWAWTLHLVTLDDEEMSAALMRWDPSPLPVPLTDRYDALALMGFAVVNGGPEAWAWYERPGGVEGSYFIGSLLRG